MLKQKLRKYCTILFGCLLLVPLPLCLIAAAVLGQLPAKLLLQSLLFAVLGVAFLWVGIKRQVPKKAPAEASAKPKAEPAAKPESSSSDMPTPPKPYPRDLSKPYGSKENPVVVGMPEYSVHLYYDGRNDRWILTDGLGNGWIR